MCPGFIGSVVIRLFGHIWKLEMPQYYLCQCVFVRMFAYLCSSVMETRTNSQRQVWQASTAPSVSIQNCHCEKPNLKNRRLIKRCITAQQMLSVMVFWPSSFASLIAADGCHWNTWITCSYNDQAHVENLSKPGTSSFHENDPALFHFKYLGVRGYLQ